MNIEEVRNYCLQKKGVTEEFPFDEDTLVFKVAGKIFLITSLSAQPFACNLKMNAELVPQYRELYTSVAPGYHMNKKYWNTVNFADGNVPRKMLLWMIDHSYAEVVKGLPKKIKEKLNVL
jgi:predicted DNA-binding protein (MmcQ/YjbR family)